MTPSNIVSYMNGVETLGGNNFGKWKQEIMFILAVMDRDESFHEERPVAPTANGDNDPTLVERSKEYEKAKYSWERPNRVALMIMNNSINPAIRGALPKEPKDAKSFMAKIEHGSSKAIASILMIKILQAKYDGQGSVREHIMKQIDMSNKLNDLKMPLPDD